MSEKTTAAVTPISSHSRFQRKQTVVPWKDSIKQPTPIVPALRQDPDELLDMDSVAATAHIRVCAWLIAHRHSKQDALDVLQMTYQDILGSFNTPNGA